MIKAFCTYFDNDSIMEV